MVCFVCGCFAGRCWCFSITLRAAYSGGTFRSSRGNNENVVDLTDKSSRVLCCMVDVWMDWTCIGWRAGAPAEVVSMLVHVAALDIY